MKTVAIIQARMGSTRLPGKALTDLCGKPNLHRVLDRVSQSKVDAIVVATEPKSIEILDFMRKHAPKNGVFIGSEDDVMARVLGAANVFGADIIVDITADCPLVDPKLIDRCINALEVDKTLDYVSNCVPVRSYPDGMDVQVYYRETLSAIENITDPDNRCHVGWNIPQHPDLCNCHCIEGYGIYRQPDLRLTLDTQEDLKLIRKLIEVCGPDASLKDYLNTFELYPDLRLINRDVRTKNPEEG